MAKNQMDKGRWRRADWMSRVRLLMYIIVLQTEFGLYEFVWLGQQRKFVNAHDKDLRDQSCA